jgi:hypothetical protein
VSRAPFPQAVSTVGCLDLDDLGAEVAEHAAHERAGEKDPQLEDAEADERSAL